MNLFKTFYFLLATQKWCSDEPKIHGLWLNKYNSPYPSYCDPEPFNITTTTPIMFDLWSDCNYDKTISLWEHEWIKHGTCAKHYVNYTQEQFFNTTITLFQKTTKPFTCFDLDKNEIDCPNIL